MKVNLNFLPENKYYQGIEIIKGKRMHFTCMGGIMPN
jgi:hypothetical protein